VVDRIKLHHRSRVGATGLQPPMETGEDIDLTPTAWQVDAACAGVDSDAFFSDDPREQRIAKRICEGCPVREQCLQYANDRREYYGVWGGQTSSRRRRQRTADNAARRAS
jgi:WhiB family redox-sensing transcriptional regulator